MKLKTFILIALIIALFIGILLIVSGTSNTSNISTNNLGAYDIDKDYVNSLCTKHPEFDCWNRCSEKDYWGNCMDTTAEKVNQYLIKEARANKDKLICKNSQPFFTGDQMIDRNGAIEACNKGVDK